MRFSLRQTFNAPGSGRPGTREQWKRNQLALAITVFVWFAGTSFVTPFLTLYLQELGGFEVDQSALWAGVTFAVTSFSAGLVAPIWGTLADKIGQKVTLQISLFGFTATLGLMAFVDAPWQVVAIRTAMGLFGGFVIAAQAIITLCSPPDRVSEGIGAIQSGRVLGMAAGPLMGGLLADSLGIRNSFFASVTLGMSAVAVASLFVHVPKREPKSHAKKTSSEGSAWKAITAPVFLGALVALTVFRLAERSFDPIIPLYVGQLGSSGLGLATTTGLIVSGGHLVASGAAVLVSRFTRQRSPRTVLLLVLAMGVITFLPIAIAHNWWQLLILRMAAGIALGAGITLGYTIGAEATSGERRGFGLGVLGSASTYGATIGFFGSGLVGSLGLQYVFIADAAFLALGLLLTGLAFRRSAAKSPEVPVTSP